MASLFNLITHADSRGKLTVIEKIVPFDIKRVFYIYGVDNSSRGYHRHKKTKQVAICLRGSCRIVCSNNLGKSEIFYLNKPDLALNINPEDYHFMDEFSSDALLMVLASEYYNPEDYVYEPYEL